MRTIDLNSAVADRWDVIVVGSSFAAFFFIHALKRRNLKVLVVERGLLVPHDVQRELGYRIPYASYRQDNSSKIAKDWTILHQFGGCSNCWWGNTPRFHPNDFRLNSLYGRGQDWPLSYEELEPHYVAAEQIMDVAGGGSDEFLPRSAPYPSPSHKLTRAERQMRAHDSRWVAMPTARSNGDRRTKCCASGTCKICPVDSKFTVLNALDEVKLGQVAYVSGLEVRSLVFNGGKAVGVACKQSGHDELIELRAPVIGLAANALSNAAILLRSGLKSPHIGRGLHEQASQFVWFDIPFDNYYGGTSTTGAGYVEYDGEFRKSSASVFIESWNAPPSLRLERGKWLQRLKIKLIAEDLLKSENRVTLVDDEPKILWQGHSEYAYAGLERALKGIDRHLPFKSDIHRVGQFETTESHIQGGTPMSAEPSMGVVDPFCRLHTHSNVYCLGAGVFPTCAAANPTLTLSALSLRAGAQL